jgi:hypothetical protein
MNRVIPTLLMPAFVACGGPDARLASVQAPVTEPAAVFPTYVAEDLNGRELAVPRDAHSDLTLVVVAFQRWQQRDIDAWLDRTAPLFERQPDLDYLELPVLKRFNRLTRWWIDRGMRSGIPQTEKRARVVTIYTDKKVFRELAGIDSEDEIHLFLVKRNGEILWRERGPVTADGVSGLESAVVSARQAKSAVVASE